MLVTAATLPVQGSCCFVRHAPRSEPWAGPWPWAAGGAAAAAAAAASSEEGSEKGAEDAEAVPYVVVVIEGKRRGEQTRPRGFDPVLPRRAAAGLARA